MNTPPEFEEWLRARELRRAEPYSDVWRELHHQIWQKHNGNAALAKVEADFEDWACEELENGGPLSPEYRAALEARLLAPALKHVLWQQGSRKGAQARHAKERDDLSKRNAAIKQHISQSVAAGADREQIVDGLVRRYGPGSKSKYKLARATLQTHVKDHLRQLRQRTARKK
jgi:hypothetical protein